MRNLLLASAALLAFAATPAMADLLPPKPAAPLKDDVQVVVGIKQDGAHKIPVDIVTDKVTVNLAREAERVQVKQVFDDLLHGNSAFPGANGSLGPLEGNIAVIDQAQKNNIGDIDQTGGKAGTALIKQDSGLFEAGNVARIEQSDLNLFGNANELNRAAILQTGGGQTAVIDQKFFGAKDGTDVDGDRTADNYAVIHQSDSYGAHATIVQQQNRGVGLDVRGFVAEFDNDAVIEQDKSEHATATIVSEGLGNSAAISQSYADYADASIYQFGVNNVAQVHNMHDYSRGYVVQSGFGNSAVITN